MDVKLSGNVEPCTIPLVSKKISTLYTIIVVFIDLQILKIRCVNYALYRKSDWSHMCTYIST